MKKTEFIKKIKTIPIQEKFNLLSDFPIQLIRRDDKRGSRRLWLDKTRDDFEYLCEKRTIEECLDCALIYCFEEWLLSKKQETYHWDWK